MRSQALGCAFHERRKVYLSYKNAVGAALAETARLQVTEDEADRYILLQQMPFSGTLTSYCASEPVAKPFLTLTDVMLEVCGFLSEEEKDNPATTSARIRMAYAVSHLICSNASKQSSKALTLCHPNERENTFCLCIHATD